MPYRRLRKTAAWIASCFFVVSIFAGVPALAGADEAIDTFNVAATVSNEGVVHVEERILYNFGSNERHGIYRDIPLVSDKGPDLGIVVNRVTDDQGQPYQYETSREGENVHIKIGDPNQTITGAHLYVLQYDVYNAVRQFSTYDELYWNAIGDQWQVAIGAASVNVMLPATSTQNVTVDCYTGPHGSTAHDCTTRIVPAQGATPVAVNVALAQQLAPGNDLTVSASFPKGLITSIAAAPDTAITATSGPAPSNDSSSWFGIVFAAIWVLGIGGVVVASIRRAAGHAKGYASSRFIIPKELKGKPVVVQYGPPDDLTPIDLGMLDDRHIDTMEFSSVIIDLAVHGYLKIRYSKIERRFLPDKIDYEFVKLKDGNDLAHPAYKIVYTMLFAGGDSIKLSDLQLTPLVGYAALQQSQGAVRTYLTERGYFDTNTPARSQRVARLKSFAPWSLIIFAIFFVLFAVLGVAGFYGFIVILIAGVVLAVAAFRALRTHLAPKGVDAIAKALGFQKFLRATEKDRLAMLDAPARQPEQFEKFLPYAMALGVEKEWGAQFERIYALQPQWLEGYPGGMNSLILASALSNFGGSFGAATSPPSSGAGGGGFSGGGSGGGGGGSW
jgi:uncharacterized membrane protein YgcG